MPLATTGRITLGCTATAGRCALFLINAFRHCTSGGSLRPRILRALHESGVRCVPVILIVAIFTGMVLGLQGHYVLSRFGASGLLGTLVSLSLCRELAPVLAALMIAGQAGSSIAAELGMQRSTEQIDALDLIGIRPEGFLAGQRLFAALLTYPILTAAFVLVGTYGGYLAGCVLLPVPAPEFWSAVHEAIRPRDVAECLIKSLAFGLLCTTIACYSGFHAHLSGLSGARAVSLGTVRAVVASSIGVLATDYLITSLLV